MARISRRRFLQAGSLAAGAIASSGFWRREARGEEMAGAALLAEFDYGDVLMTSDLHESQLMSTHAGH
ncbi:MAG: twin-arginine translocation signal domain-containing protein [Terriglobia bacterium]